MRNSSILQVNLSISICRDLSFEQQQAQKGLPNENWASFQDESVKESIEENLNVKWKTDGLIVATDELFGCNICSIYSELLKSNKT